MKAGMFLLATIIVTCAVTLVSGRKPDPVPANRPQDYGCAALSVNVLARAHPVGVVQGRRCRSSGGGASFGEEAEAWTIWRSCR